MLCCVVVLGSSSVSEGAEQLSMVACVSKVKMDRCPAVPAHLARVLSFALLKSACMPPNVYVSCCKTGSLAILQVPCRPSSPITIPYHTIHHTIYDTIPVSVWRVRAATR